MSTTTDTVKDLIQAALTKRDREWEECLKMIDTRPPMIPDREWFREWTDRVKKRLQNP